MKTTESRRSMRLARPIRRPLRAPFVMKCFPINLPRLHFYKRDKTIYVKIYTYINKFPIAHKSPWTKPLLRNSGKSNYLIRKSMQRKNLPVPRAAFHDTQDGKVRRKAVRYTRGSAFSGLSVISDSPPPIEPADSLSAQSRHAGYTAIAIGRYPPSRWSGCSGTPSPRASRRQWCRLRSRCPSRRRSYRRTRKRNRP